MYQLYPRELADLQCTSNYLMQHIELHNSSYVREFILSITLKLLAGTKPTYKVQLRSLPKILLH